MVAVRILRFTPKHSSFQEHKSFIIIYYLLFIIFISLSFTFLFFCDFFLACAFKKKNPSTPPQKKESAVL